jgi:hypothetical protein
MQAYDLVKLRSTAWGSRRRCHRQTPIADDRRIRSFPVSRFSDAVRQQPKRPPLANNRPGRPAPATGNENPAQGMGSGADYYRDRHVVVTGGTGALGTAMVGALLEAGAARARRCLKFCEIAGIKADEQDWASLYQQRIAQQTSTGGAVPARSSATGLADGRAKPSPP